MTPALRALLAATTALICLPALAQEAKPDMPAAATEKPAAAAPTPAPATAAATPTPVPATAPAAPTKDYTILKMGNEEIKNSEVNEVWKGLFPGDAAPDFNSFDENIRQNVLRGLASERLIYAEAVKAGFDKNEDVKKRIAAMQKQVVMQAFMEQKAKDLVTDDQLRAAYNQKAATTKGQEEVKARHILVASEEDAKKLYDQLKKGADFEKLAKEKSADKGSGGNGGELGWFAKDKMVPEFADAAFKLKKGDISAPVKSEFGWHIIKLEDRRPVQIPTFEESKEALKTELANKAVQSYVENLLKKADIKYYDANGKEKSFSSSLTPAAGTGAQ